MKNRHWGSPDSSTGTGAINRPGTIQKPRFPKWVSDFLCVIQHHSKIGKLLLKFFADILVVGKLLFTVEGTFQLFIQVCHWCSSFARSLNKLPGRLLLPFSSCHAYLEDLFIKIKFLQKWQFWFLPLHFVMLLEVAESYASHAISNRNALSGMVLMPVISVILCAPCFLSVTQMKC